MKDTFTSVSFIDLISNVRKTIEESNDQHFEHICFNSIARDCSVQLNPENEALIDSLNAELLDLLERYIIYFYIKFFIIKKKG